MSSLRDILARAHSCETLLAFAEDLQAREGRCPCPGAPQHQPLRFACVWHGLDRHDWLTWLMRHCPDQFEDSWRDVTSALHQMASAYCVPTVGSVADRERAACRFIRLYVRLRG